MSIARHPMVMFMPKPSGAAFDADYQAVLDRATVLGYTLPSSGQQAKQNTLVLALKSAGVWAKLDVWYCFATDGNSDFATLNWKAPTLHQITKVNSPPFTTNVGFAGDSSSAYLDYNFNPTSHGLNYISSSASFGYHIVDIGTQVNTTQGDFAASGTTYNSWIRRLALRLYINSIGFTAYTSTIVNGEFVHLNRTDASNIQLNKDGVNVQSSSLSGLGVPNANFQSFLRSGIYSNPQLGCAFIGGNLQTEQAAFYAAWNAYRTSL